MGSLLLLLQSADVPPQLLLDLQLQLLIQQSSLFQNLLPQMLLVSIQHYGESAGVLLGALLLLTLLLPPPLLLRPLLLLNLV